MGNNQCCCSQQKIQNEDRLRQIMERKNLEFLNEISQTRQSHTKDQIHQFHRVIVKKVINVGRYNYLTNEFAPDKTNKNTTTMQIYFFIKQQLIKEKSHIFLQIVNAYQTFIIKIFELQTNSRAHKQINVDGNLQSFQSISYLNPSDIYDKISNTSDIKNSDQGKAVNSNSQDDIGRNFNSTILCSEKLTKNQFLSQILTKLSTTRNIHNFSKLLLKQCNFIFELLNLILLKSYKNQFDKHIGTDSDFLPVIELSNQRIIQHFLLSKNCPITSILYQLGQKYYREEDMNIEGRSIYAADGSMLYQTFEPSKNEPVLDQSLLPKILNCEDINSKLHFLNSLGQSSLDSDKSIRNSQQSLERSKKEQYTKDIIEKDQIKQMLVKSSKVVKEEQIPYSQTFPLIDKIIETQKLWKKFDLIKKLDELVIFLFMRKRSQSQFEKFYNTIVAEDSKTEIFLFILYSYWKTKPSINMNDMLFVPLRLMYEFNGFLNTDVKFIYSPFFIRFYGVVELLIYSEICE